ncbi:MAG: cytochrome P450, partial [Rhodothermales bacterium]
MPTHPDPFHDDRLEAGVKTASYDGERIPLILGLKDVRKAAKDWQTFSSDHPFKVVPHTEEHVRSVRQLPIETDPPDHTDYRKLVEPLFRRPTQQDYQDDMKLLIASVVRDAVAQDEVEVVQDFALPLQCRALTRLLGVPESEADIWMGWGVHVFEGDGKAKGSDLDSYVRGQLLARASAPGDDFFSLLNQVEFRGRKLNAEEKCGFVNVAFAGGRDTIINTVASIIVYLAE